MDDHFGLAGTVRGSASVMTELRHEVETLLPPIGSDLVVAITGNAVALREGRWHTHHSFGRIVDHLARHVARVHYYAPQVPEDRKDTCDYAFSTTNLTVHPWAERRNSLHALRHPTRLLRDYSGMFLEADCLFLRGSGPLIWTVHRRAARARMNVVHWIVGNPVALLQVQPRGYGRWLDRLGLLFARFEQFMLRRAVRESRAYVLANGFELAKLFESPRTVPVVSTSITAEEFLVRDNACEGDRIRLLFVGFIRPEKGLEYLLRAMPLIECGRPVELSIVGSWSQFPAEHDRLTRVADELRISHRISWEGYAAFGAELFSHLDRADLLVLPSLSEGTPRVLVEARARSVPVVSTRVGGIPGSVTDGVDGILVPPGDAPALAAAITRIVGDRDFRGKIVAAGRERVASFTVDRFVNLVVGLLALRDNRVAG
jgi:glycosyltransferase involved in cell wall biosynthesis